MTKDESRLRAMAGGTPIPWDLKPDEMAAVRWALDEIERLRAELERLQAGAGRRGQAPRALSDLTQELGDDPEPVPSSPGGPAIDNVLGRWQDRLAFDPDTSETSPCIRGTWVTADRVISLIADGWSWPDILRSYPEITDDDIRACMSWYIEGRPGR